MNHPSPTGLKSDTQYLEMLSKNYPNVPMSTIKKVEKKYYNETEMCAELERLNNQDEKYENRIRIGSQLAKIRTEKGLSTRQLAEKCGVTFQNISKIEHGKYNVSIDILSKICKSLDMELNITEREA